jgi:uncharacterized membrane protein YkvA (DUF1232 family)
MIDLVRAGGAVTEPSWKLLLRTPTSTITKVLQSFAFLQSRKRSAAIAENPVELRALAASVELLDYTNPPLAVVADRVVAAVHFLRARANQLDSSDRLAPSSTDAAEMRTGHPPSAGVATRERLLIACLHYLVTPVDLVPDFRPAGYVDDVVLLAWVFGVTASELEPYLIDYLDGVEPDSMET